MKFEKFLKSVGTHGVIFTDADKDKWLFCSNVMMKLPSNVTVLSTTECKAPAFVQKVIDDFYDENCHSAELTKAILPYPDSKAKDIQRIFEDAAKNQFAACNNDFGLIETSDDAYVDKDKALIVAAGYPDVDVVGIIFDDEYVNAELEKQKNAS